MNEPKTDVKDMDLEKLAQSIEVVGAAVKRLKASRLTRRALIVLIQDSAGAGRVTRKQIEIILDCAEKLPTIYLKQPKKK